MMKKDHIAMNDKAQAFSCKTYKNERMIVCPRPTNGVTLVLAIAALVVEVLLLKKR